MFKNIIEKVESLIDQGWFNEEDTEILEKELIELTKVERKLPFLEEKSDLLNCLKAAGVDNWSGYGYAQELMNDEES